MPSFAQSTSDSLVVCFTLGEAKAISDTLWSRLDDRARRELAHMLILRQGEQVERMTRDMDRLRQQVQPLMESEADAQERAKASEGEAMRWKLKAKGRGNKGLLIGLGIGGALTYLLMSK